MPIVINSKFRPFSYQEMLQPVLMETQAHQALEDAYSELDTKASMWEKLADSAIDKDVYNQYKSYADNLRKESDRLAQEGLTPTSRRSMLDMRSRYAQKIHPIEEAYAERQRQARVQQEMMLKDPTHMYRVNANTVGLREFMNNPNYDALSDNYSGALLTKQVGEAAAQLKTALMDRSKLKGLGLPYQYERMLQYGATPEQAMQAMSKDPNALPILNKIVDDVMESSGIRAWGNDELSQRAEAFARQGLYNAIGTKKFENFTDNFSMQDELHKRQFTRQQQALQQQRLNSLAINPLNIYSSRELNEQEKEYNNNVKQFSKYFTKGKEGNYTLTREGWNEYHKRYKVDKPGRVVGSGPYAHMSYERVETDSPFKQFVDSIGGKGHVSSTGYGANQSTTIGNLFGKYYNDNPVSRTAVYDAKKVTEYDYTIDSSQQSDMKDAIMTAMRGGDLVEVDYNGKSNKFEDQGSSLSMKDLKNDKYKVTATRFSPYGNTVMIQDDEGTVRRYRLPAGINTTNESNRDRSMQAALVWQNVINTGMYNGRAASPEEISYAQQQYMNAIQQSYLYHSQLGLQNKTKEQEYNPYGY